MRVIDAALSAAAIGLTMVSLLAQAKPTLAGKWVTEFLRTTSDGAGLGLELTITQDANALTLEYLSVGEAPTRRKLVYKLDGSESRNSIAGRVGTTEQVSKAVWNGSVLFITTAAATGDQTLTFSLEGNNLVVGVAASGAGSGTRRTVGKRVS